MSRSVVLGGESVSGPRNPESPRALMLRVTGIDIARCQLCAQGLMRRSEVLPPMPRGLPIAVVDTS